MATAFAEIVGGYLPCLWPRRDGSAWLILSAMVAPAAFAWSPTLHPSLGAGPAYTAYGGVDVSVAVLWMWSVEETRPDRWDVFGVAITLVGMAVIAFALRSA